MAAPRPATPAMSDTQPVVAVAVALGLICAAAPRPTLAEESKDEQTQETPDKDREDDKREESLGDLLDSLDDRRDQRQRRRRQQDGEQRERDDVPLEELDLEQARARGFDFGDDQDDRAGGGASLTAVTAGAVVHGAGHFAAGNARAGWWLAGSQAAGAGLLTAGILGTNRSRGGGPFGMARIAGVIGAGLLGAGYLADIAGTLPTDRERRGLPRNDSLHREFELEAGYRFRRTEGSPLSHFAHARAAIDGGFWSVSARTEHELQLAASSVGLEATLDPAVSRSRLTRPTLVVGGDYLYSGETGEFRRWSAFALAGGSVDLGLISPGLSEFAVGALVGGERSWLDWGRGTYADWVPSARVFSHFNLGRRLHTRVSYRLDTNDWLAADRNLAGIGEVSLRFDTDGPFDLRLGGMLGGGIGITTALQYRP